MTCAMLATLINEQIENGATQVEITLTIAEAAALAAEIAAQAGGGEA